MTNTPPLRYSASRYLLSKVTVDDRALNRSVVDRLRAELTALPTDRPRVLEIGCGVGTMLARLTEWGLLKNADYTFVDLDAELLAVARQTLSERENVRADTASGELLFQHTNGEVRVRFVHADATEYAEAQSQKFHLVIANALLDLLDLKPALHSIWKCLEPKGLYWFTINFDGETLLLPETPLDEAVMAVYHRSMDERMRDGKPSGTSRTGRLLLTALPETGATLLAAGSSDWVVCPSKGGYPAEEAYFLRHILDTVITTVQGDPSLAPDDFAAWARLRETQIAEAKLCYVAHQIDVMGHAP